MSQISVATALNDYLSQVTQPVSSGDSAVSNSAPTQVPATDSASLSGSVTDVDYMLLTDTFSDGSIAASIVQVETENLDAIASALLVIRDQLGAVEAARAGGDSQALEAELSALVTMEDQLSEMIGQSVIKEVAGRTVLEAGSTADQVQFSTFNFLDAQIAQVEVNFGKVITQEHNPDGCPICQGMTAALPEGASAMTTTGGGSPSSVENPQEAPTDPATSTVGSTTVAGGDDYIEQSLINLGNSVWNLSAGGTLSYSYYDDTTAVPYSYGTNTPTSMKAYESDLDEIFGLWDDVLTFDFQKVTESATAVGEIRTAYMSAGDTPDGVAAYAYYPSNSAAGGDMWYGADVQSNYNFEAGTYGRLTFLHELGHSLGLQHPFSDGNGEVTLPSAEDNLRNTVMTYTSVQDSVRVTVDGTGGISTNDRVYSSTVMPYDILAIEHMYGANTDTNTGNNTYSWAVNPEIIETVVDHGGTDTFDLSNQTRANDIDLSGNIGVLSVGKTTVSELAQQLVAEAALAGATYSVSSIESFLNGLNGGVYLGEENIKVGPGNVIENVIGGSGIDTFTGNSANNAFQGNAGDDVFDGGAGDDTLVVNGNKADFTVTAAGAGYTVTDNVGTDGTDTVSNVEFVQFDDGTFSIADLTDGDPSNDADTGVDALVGVAAGNFAKGDAASLDAAYTAMAADAAAAGATTAGGGSTGSSSSSGGGSGGRPHRPSSLNVMTQAGAAMALTMIDYALEKISLNRASLGAFMNRLDATVSNLQSASINLESSRSKMLDADMAQEITVLAKSQILQRAGQRMIMISQMNSQQVSRLLNG